MPKAQLVNIETAATQLGYKPPKGRINPDVRISLCINYLEQFNLTKVTVDPAFINPHTKKVNPFCLKQSEINKLNT